MASTARCSVLAGRRSKTRRRGRRKPPARLRAAARRATIPTAAIEPERAGSEDCSKPWPCSPLRHVGSRVMLMHTATSISRGAGHTRCLMPEGHTIHRIARDHDAFLAGRTIRCRAHRADSSTPTGSTAPCSNGSSPSASICSTNGRPARSATSTSGCSASSACSAPTGLRPDRRGAMRLQTEPRTSAPST